MLFNIFRKLRNEIFDPISINEYLWVIFAYEEMLLKFSFKVHVGKWREDLGISFTKFVYEDFRLLKRNMIVWIFERRFGIYQRQMNRTCTFDINDQTLDEQTFRLHRSQKNGVKVRLHNEATGGSNVWKMCVGG